MKTRRELKKNRRRDQVVEAALKVFSEHGIGTSTIQDVADEAAIGVASVYRYFGNKGELVVQAAILNWSRGIAHLVSPAEPVLRADLRMHDIMGAYIDIFRRNPAFYRFLEDFDTFISRLDYRPASMELYERILGEFDDGMVSIIRTGMEEGTFSSDIDPAAYYAMAGQAVMALSQKLVNRGHVVSRDDRYNQALLIRMLIDTLVGSITTGRKGEKT